MGKEDTNNESVHLIENPMLHRLSNIDGNHIQKLAEIYRTTWATSGIHISQSDSEQKIQRFHPDNTFVLIEPKSNHIIAQIHTVSAQITSLNNLIDQFPTYASVEQASQRAPDKKANTIICFSLNSLPDYRIHLDHHTQSSAQTIIEMLPKTLRKIAYSYMNIPIDTASYSQMAEHYMQNLRDGTQKNGGPIFMHEYFGGVAMAFLAQSRNEHLRGGGGNALVTYPMNLDENTSFSKIKYYRARLAETDRSLYYTNNKNTIILNDINFKF